MTGTPDPFPSQPVPDVPGPGPSDPDPGPPEARSGVDALLRIEGELAAVDAALTRLDDGTYGFCRFCREPIDDARMADDPTSEACSAHGGLDAARPA